MGDPSRYVPWRRLVAAAVATAVALAAVAWFVPVPADEKAPTHHEVAEGENGMPARPMIFSSMEPVVHREETETSTPPPTSPDGGASRDEQPPEEGEGGERGEGGDGCDGMYISTGRNGCRDGEDGDDG